MSKCLHPITAWKCGTMVTKDHLISPRLVFSASEASSYFIKLGMDPSLSMSRNQVDIDCGHCINCEMRKRKDYATRLSLEARMSSSACFITLTYNEESVPRTDLRSWNDPEKQFESGIDWRPESFPLREQTLVPAHLQKFLKRLRRHLEYVPEGCHIDPLTSSMSPQCRLLNDDGDFVRDHIKEGKHIRYFGVGEYGGKSRRPHYHLIIFGWKPSDMLLHHLNGSNPVYTSVQLQKLWPYGFSTVDELTVGRAMYCARYVTKKFSRLTEDKSDWLCPEFVLSSRRNGGIGASWFDKFGKDACLRGFVSYNVGDRFYKASIPRYFWSRLRRTRVDIWLKCRDMRLAFINTSRPSVLYEDRVRAAAFMRNSLALEKTKETL